MSAQEAAQPADPFRALCDLCVEQSWRLFLTPCTGGAVFVSVYTDEMKLSDEPLVMLWDPLPADEAFRTVLERAQKWLEDFREWAGIAADTETAGDGDAQG